MAEEEDNLPILPTTEIKRIQQIVGSFLYYARGVDPTIHPAINQIASNQATPTEKKQKKPPICFWIIYILIHQQN